MGHKYNVGDKVKISRIEGVYLDGVVIRTTKTRVTIGIGGQPAKDFMINSGRETGVRKGTAPYMLTPGSLEEVGGRPAVVEKLAQDMKDGKWKVEGLTVSQMTARRLLDQIENPPEKVTYVGEAKNLVQWLPKCRITGYDRIRIVIANGGPDREYYFIDVDKSTVALEYLDERFMTKQYTLNLRNGVPISCTCKDHTERKHDCKHMKALKVALPKRPEPLHFG